MTYAIIWDMDGVLVETQVIHSQIESTLLAEYGVHLTPDEITNRYAGMKSRDMLADINAEYTLSLPIEEIVQAKYLRIDKVLASLRDTQGLKPMPGAKQLVQRIAEANFSQGVASSSRRSAIKLVLEGIGLAPYFPVTVSGEDVQISKPHPDIFWLAAKKLDMSPQYCTVIEDSRAGMTAAKAAGMYCIGLVPDPDKEYPADRLVTSLTDLTLDDLRPDGCLVAK